MFWVRGVADIVGASDAYLVRAHDVPAGARTLSARPFNRHPRAGRPHCHGAATLKTAAVVFVKDAVTIAAKDEAGAGARVAADARRITEAVTTAVVRLGGRGSDYATEMRLQRRTLR